MGDHITILVASMLLQIHRWQEFAIESIVSHSNCNLYFHNESLAYIRNFCVNVVTGNKSSIPGEKTDGLLIPALMGIVVAYWSQDSELNQEHINGSHHNVFTYSDDFDSLLPGLIETFSFDGQTDIDATESGKLDMSCT